MDRRAGLDGSHFRLMSRHNTLLGVVTIPASWVTHLHHIGRVSFNPATTTATCQKRVGTLVAAAGENNDTLIFNGASIEDLETMPGVTFAPSAAYLRSMLP